MSKIIRIVNNEKASLYMPLNEKASLYMPLFGMAGKLGFRK